MNAQFLQPGRHRTKRIPRTPDLYAARCSAGAAGYLSSIIEGQYANDNFMLLRVDKHRCRMQRDQEFRSADLAISESRGEWVLSSKNVLLFNLRIATRITWTILVSLALKAD